MDVIEAKGLVIRFGDFTSVDGIDLNVREGEIFGLLGPNGAGKTTSVKVLTTMKKATSGDIIINSVDVKDDTVKARSMIGVVQQHYAMDMDISVRENIISRAVLHKIPLKVAKERMMELCDAIGLTPYLEKKGNELSGGWKRKTAIVCALMHDPKILFLDEPTTGLDTQSRHMLWDIVRILNKRGTTIFLTTHYMDEAEALCDRISIINKGKIIDTGSPSELCQSIGKFTVEYDAEDGTRKYSFFPDRDSAKEFFDSVMDRNAVMRGTHLEDVFLEKTGRLDIKSLEGVL
ncbi:MAG: ABC transporter ATP-binding protein [Candidatus Methanomethylophilaceae archaeon]|nr:ABC transporter ATP-binding protein [Candidatus Methanomethylophilaceae archaeon]